MRFLYLKTFHTSHNIARLVLTRSYIICLKTFLHMKPMLPCNKWEVLYEHHRQGYPGMRNYESISCSCGRQGIILYRGRNADNHCNSWSKHWGNTVLQSQTVLQGLLLHCYQEQYCLTFSLKSTNCLYRIKWWLITFKIQNKLNNYANVNSI